MAKIVNSHDTRHVPLHVGIPLKTPMTIIVMPCAECNFQCSYCLHSEKTYHTSNVVKRMSINTAKRLAEQCKAFPDVIKRITLAGLGEPLMMQQEICDIVRILKDANISKSVAIATNGYLLSESISDALIDAGLDLLRISIQGLDDKTYETITSRRVSLSKIIENIRYYYRNKKNDAIVYVKILDLALGAYSQEAFFKTFEDVCDEIAVEHAVPLFSHLHDSIHGRQNIYGQDVSGSSISICNQPFFSCMVYPNGDVGSCCAEKTEVFGSICDSDIHSIWHGMRRREFLLQQLRGRNNLSICQKCLQPEYSTRFEDILDPHIEQIKNQIENKWPSA